MHRSLHAPPPRHAVAAARQTRARGAGIAGIVVAGLAVAALLVAVPAAADPAPLLGSPPSAAGVADDDAVNVGAVLKVPRPVWATGVRFYKGSGNVGPHVGTLWSSDGTALATATFNRETASGWQLAMLSAPVPLQPGREYTVSYLAPRGHYSAVEGAFARGATYRTNRTVQSQGVFTYGTRQAFPTSAWHDSSYFVALATSATAPVGTPPTTPPLTTPPPTPPPTTPPSATWPAAPPTAGTPAGRYLAPMAGTTITTPDTVIDGKSISGQLTIAAANVTVRNSRVSGSGDYGIYVRSGSATISTTTVAGFDNGVAGDNYTADRVEVTALQDDGFKLGSNVTVTNSWCHDLSPEPGAHSDCGQVQAGIVNLVFSHNWFDPDTEDGNAALFISPSLGPSSRGPLTITDNVLGGGNYTLFCVDGNYGQYFIDGITISRNRFLRDGRYGAVRVNVPITASGNTWWDTGAPLNMS